MADRLRPALRFLAIAFVLYLMLAFILMSMYEFVRYGVFPAALVIIALGLVYGVRRRARRSARPSNVRLLVDAPPGSDPARVLEERLDQYRKAAPRDPSMMPSLALRLATLSYMYGNRDPGKSEAYLREALEVVNSGSYPEGEEADDVRRMVRALAAARSGGSQSV